MESISKVLAQMRENLVSTLSLFALVFVLGCAISGALTAQQAIRNLDTSARGELSTMVTLNSDILAMEKAGYPPLPYMTEEIIAEVGALPYVKSYSLGGNPYFFDNAFTLYSADDIVAFRAAAAEILPEFWWVEAEDRPFIFFEYAVESLHTRATVILWVAVIASLVLVSALTLWIVGGQRRELAGQLTAGDSKSQLTVQSAAMPLMVIVLAASLALFAGNSFGGELAESTLGMTPNVGLPYAADIIDNIPPLPFDEIMLDYDPSLNFMIVGGFVAAIAVLLLVAALSVLWYLVRLEKKLQSVTSIEAAEATQKEEKEGADGQDNSLSRKILIRNNILAVAGLALVPLLIFAFAHLRIMLFGHPPFRSWGSSLTSLYMPGMWFLLFAALVLKYRPRFNTLSLVAVPLAAILFFWSAGIAQLLGAFSETAMHWGFFPQVFMLMIGELGEAFMIFAPIPPGEGVGYESAGYNYFTGGVAVGLYAAAYMYLGIQIRGIVQGRIIARREKNKLTANIVPTGELAVADSVTPTNGNDLIAATACEEIQTDESSTDSTASIPDENESRSRLNKPLWLNNFLALVGHFAIALLVYWFWHFGQDFGIELDGLFSLAFLPVVILYQSGLIVLLLHFIFGLAALQVLPKKNFLSVLSLIIYSSITFVVVPILMGTTSLAMMFAQGDIFWTLSYIVTALVMAFAMYLGVFAKSIILSAMKKRAAAKPKEETQDDEEGVH